MTDPTKPNGTMPTGDGQKANDWVLEEFSIAQLVKKTGTVYLEALGRKRSKCQQEPVII